jgi:FMN-dependent NADH-azoreductase
MTTVLHIDASPRTTLAGSRVLSRALVDAFVQALPESEVRYRDLAAQPPALIDEAWIAANCTPEVLRTAEMAAALHESDALIDELLAAELLVIGVPMHNFTVSTLLKCYIDQVVRAGRTFQFTAHGPQGLLGGKQAVVVTTRGSDFSASHMAGLDYQEPYLRSVLGFLGFDEVRFITCNGMDTGDRERAMQEARVVMEEAVAEVAEALEIHAALRAGGPPDAGLEGRRLLRPGRLPAPHHRRPLEARGPTPPARAGAAD